MLAAFLVTADLDLEQRLIRCTAAVEAQVPEGLVQWSSVGDAMFGIDGQNTFQFSMCKDHRCGTMWSGPPDSADNTFIILLD